MCELSPRPSVIPEEDLVSQRPIGSSAFCHKQNRTSALEVSQYGLFAIVFPARALLKAGLNECFNIKACEARYRLQSGGTRLQSVYKH